MSSALANKYDEMKQDFINLSPEGQAYIKNESSKSGWLRVASSTEYETYINYNYVEASNYDITKAWTKRIVSNDISKDGLALGDYLMIHTSYNCKDKTYKDLSYAAYNHKNGQVIRSSTLYKNYESPIPESVGETQLESICFYKFIKSF
ncbi:surface-adhesin E family protein [Acinetobacter baumannii]|uniref:surface-adhesin E family protein n=1 Tax=Acinetobacter pittii TaxID=48296 RepID=UPI003B436FF0